MSGHRDTQQACHETTTTGPIPVELTAGTEKGAILSVPADHFELFKDPGQAVMKMKSLFFFMTVNVMDVHNPVSSN